MAKTCKDCGKSLGLFEIVFETCDHCAEKRRYAKITQDNFPKTVSGSEPPPLTSARTDVSQETGWVEVLLSLAWILCFCAAGVFAFLAVNAATDRYEQAAAVVFTTYAISLAVSGIIFAAIGKIIATLTSVNDNLRLLVTQNEVKVVHREEGPGSATDKVS